MPFKKNKLFIFLCILLPILYGIFFIRNFSTPLSSFEGGDIEEWEYVGYFLSENIRFTPFPHLELDHNQTFYPFGTKQVFLDWSLESNYWFAFFYKNFGFGAWLNFYSVLSLIITILGSYLILKRDFGQNKAFFVGFIVTFFNFYALLKYPGHFPHSTIHWTVLSIFTDFILLKRLFLKEEISLKWAFLKAFLLIAVLGLNMGYVAGYALSSFTLSFIFAFILLGKRYFQQDFQIKFLIFEWKRQFAQNKKLYLFLSLPIFLYSFFLLPIIFQIYFEAKSFQIDSSHLQSLWVHPFRILFPFFPKFNAIYHPIKDILKDMPEGEAAGSVGWLMVLLGILGFFQNIRKNWFIFLPISILLILGVFYHPVRVPTLRIFPWFEFNRVGARFTSTIPIIFCCYFLLFDFKTKLSKQILIPTFLILFFIEGKTVYTFINDKKTFYFENSFLKYMSVVEKQEGEAVLDFPFCIVGGDGAGHKENLCPVYQKTCGIYAYRRFHHKKVIGGYYSHIPEGELKLLEKSGVGKMAFSDGNWQTATKIINDFSDEQLEYFIKYFQYNDFCGINIYKDLIPKAMYEKIILKIGKPIISTKISGAGNLEFIAKPKNWQQFEDKSKGKAMKFPCGC